MAQTGFTPIQLYRTTTASAVPVAGNLAAGELAINLTDKKLYAKDASNNVFLLADASSGSTTAANLAGGAAGSLPYQTGANATTFRAIGTAGQVLQVNSGATAPEWVSSSGTGNVARTTSPSFTTPSLGAATATSINGLTLTSSTGALTVANGKTLTANSTLTLAGVDGKTLTVNSSWTLTGTDATTMTFPTTSATLARTDAGQTFTGTNVFSSAPQVSTLTSTRVVYAGASGVLQDNANLTFDGTSLTMGGNPTLSAGTANGVLFLNGSKVVTSGSALTFDGTNLGLGGTPNIYSGYTAMTLNNAVNGPILDLNYAGTRQGTFLALTNELRIGSIANIPFTFYQNGSEQMCLTSTGLGIGTSSPSGQLSLGTNGSTQVGSQILLYDAGSASNTNNYGLAVNASTGEFSASAGTSGYFTFYTLNRTERMRLDASGNLGLGVTPSAWAGQTLGYDVLQAGTAAFYNVADFHAEVSFNQYIDSSGTRRYITANAAAFQRTGASGATGFSWHTSTDLTPTAGNAISFSQAMTLDASGNLVVGTTSSPAYGSKLRVEGGIETFATQFNAASGTSAQFELVNRSASAGFDFYVNSGGTLAARIPAAGGMVVGAAALATAATDGFLYVPTCAGTPTGTPTTQTGTAPIVVDTTNNKLYFYSGGQWRDAGP
jgi:hypothetical protein